MEISRETYALRPDFQGNSRSSSGTNTEILSTYDFLLVIHSNSLGPPRTDGRTDRNDISISRSALHASA